MRLLVKWTFRNWAKNWTGCENENKLHISADLWADDLQGQPYAASYCCGFSVAQHLIHVVVLQDNGLRRHPGYPWNGRWIIPVERKVKSMNWFDFVCSALVFSVYSASPFIHLPLSLTLALASPPCPLTLCPALFRTPVISWGRGNRHHGLSSHPSSCTWPLPSPRAPLLRVTCQRETEVSLVQQHQRKRRKEKQLFENVELGVRAVI